MQQIFAQRDVETIALFWQQRKDGLSFCVAPRTNPGDEEWSIAKRMCATRVFDRFGLILQVCRSMLGPGFSTELA